MTMRPSDNVATMPAEPFPNEATRDLLRRVLTRLLMDADHALEHNDPLCPTCARVRAALNAGIGGRYVP